MELRFCDGWTQMDRANGWTVAHSEFWCGTTPAVVLSLELT